MYSRFVKNFHNYMSLNKIDENFTDYRLSITKPIFGIADIKTLEFWKLNDPKLYEEAAHLLYEISKRKDRIHAFKAFSWELWGYGFDVAELELPLTDRLEEQLKLIELLLGTHYWQ
jgi:hypothetical protein